MFSLNKKIWLLIVGLAAFTYPKLLYANNSIKFSPNYISKFYPYDPGDVYEYVLVSKFELNDRGFIKLLNIKGWGGEEPGDFRKIEIVTKNRVKYEFDNSEGWVKPYDPIEKYLTNDYFLEINIGGSEPILIFFGYIYASLPGWLTIISLQGTKPEIIFNKELSLAKIVPNGDNYKLIICNDKHFIEDYYEEKYVKGKLISRKPKVKNPYKFCSEIYIENNELKVVPCTRTLADDEKEKVEENEKAK